MVLLFLSWPQARCTEDVDTKGEEIFDQLATASENVVHAVRFSNVSSKSLEEQLPSVPSSIGATVHYENSNGFVPMIPTNTPSYDESDSSSLEADNLEEQDEQSEDSNVTNVVSARDSSTTKAKKLEEDLAYSSEARIFLNLPGSLTNRRSFDLQESPNEFELLKVNNDTPAVANYQDFYQNLRSTVNTEIDDGQPDATSSGRANGERRKRIESYVQNYRQPQQTKNKNLYNQYHSYSDAQDTKKLTYEPEKVPGNYRQQNAANYDGHGQSAVRHNVAALSSSSRTNYQANELTHSGTPGGTYDNVAESSRTRHKFSSKPVVVAEPSTYKVQFNGQLQNSDNEYKTSRNLESSSSSETSNRYDAYNDNRQRSYHRTEDSRNLSDESSDYPEYIERPRRVQKSRRRPPYSDSSRKLPKEHRGTPANGAEEQDNHNYNSSRQKSQRHRVKANPWTNDDSINLHEESVEDVKHDIRVGGTEIKSTKMQHGSRPKNTNTWNQISPNLEISHSNGIELDQMEKPKYVFPVKVNFMPVTNFDHATALGSSQGFDVSNALLQNIMTASPIGAYTTSTPLLSTSPSIYGQNLAISKNVVNTANLGVSTPVPDIIVGQSSFQNPIHTVLLSQSNGQNKVADAVRATYLPSTMAPVFTLTSSLTPTLQSVPLQSNVTPRTAFAVTPTPTTVVQHVPINQVHTGVQQLLVPQPTVQTFPGFIQTPVQANTGYQIQVNPHGLQGQNLMNHGNLQMQTLPTTSTLLSSQAIPESRINMSPDESKRNMYTTSGGNLLATASLTVGQNEQKQATNIHSYYLHNHNTQQVAKPQGEIYHVLKDIDMTPKTKTYLQANQVAPTVLQPNPTLSGIATNPQQYFKLQSNGIDDAMQQLQIQLNRAQLLKNNRPSVTLQTADNVIGHSNSVNAHLPNVGTKNVEIVNPNIKPSPIDTTVNTFNTMQYPATVLTTPIPIFSTIAPVTPQTMSLQNYVDSLTASGTKAKQLGTVDLKTSQNQERPMFNPINFVPNVDIIKNQHALNKLPSNEPVQQGLSLVPVMPGGNFFKPSFTAQNELILKPKLASDLQNYAEEMFKESLKTMYNSQKWNNDRRPPAVSQNHSEASDLAKLRLEVQKLTASLSESKYKDMLEAHQSENKVRTTDAPNFSSGKKKPDALLATLEHLLKTRPSGPIHIYHDTSRPGRIPKPSGDSSFDFRDEFHDESHLREFLTPPRPNHLRTKGAFHEKPIKNKRPGAVRFKNGKGTLVVPRKPGRGHSSSRPNGLETSSSNINVHLDGPHYHIPPFDVDNMDFESRHQPSYPTFTTSSPDIFNNILRELRSSNKNYDINHPRMHNLFGLLMKNKQLPSRSTQNYPRDKDQVRQFFDTERRQLQQQFYDDTLKDYILDKFEGASQSDTIANRKVYSGNGAA